MELWIIMVYLIVLVCVELTSWDNIQSGVDINAELQILAAKAPLPEDGQQGKCLLWT
jgi:hypothetical protein